MNISIEYCVVWNFKPKAVGLADALQKQRNDIEIELIDGSGGAFEVKKDGELIFSKLQLGYFPEVDEILNKL